MAGAAATNLTQRAYSLLSRREHSRKELARLLSTHAESAEQLLALLDQLQQDGYQSDERFAESFIRSRAQRGQGEVRIRNELQQRGVAADVIGTKLAEAEVDWFELAVQQRLKKAGSTALESPKERAKIQRFLLYRGFTHEQCQHALDSYT